MRALLISPNEEERDYLAFALRHMGLQVASAPDDEAGLKAIKEAVFDFIVYSTKGREGLETIGLIRQHVRVPMMLIADALSEDDHCDFLDAGVGCVLGRPVSMRLFERYSGLMLKRSEQIPSSVLAPLSAETISLNTNDRTVVVAGREPRRLTQLEFRLLYVLMRNEGQVIETEDLVERVWGYNGEGNRDLVRGLVRRLRKKIDGEDGEPSFIENLQGIGYRFSALRPMVKS